MVVAGVIPIDRLTDIRAPIELVAQRLGRGQLESCYGFRLPPPMPHEPPSTPPSAQQLLRWIHDCLLVTTD
jgi:large subunit GTPase 1